MVLKQGLDAEHGRFAFTSKVGGEHLLCFANNMSTPGFKGGESVMSLPVLLAVTYGVSS